MSRKLVHQPSDPLPASSTPAENASDRRDAILAAALRCFLENGFDGTRIEDIRDRCGASVGSIYHHFGNKDRIAATLLVDALADQKRRLRAMLDEAQGAEAMVRAVVYAYLDWILANPELARFVMAYRNRVASGLGADELQRHNREELSELFERLRKLRDASEIRALPPDCYVSLVLGPVNDYLRRWFGGRAETPPAALREVFANAAWAVLAPETSA